MKLGICGLLRRGDERGDARRIMWLSLTKNGQVGFDAHVRPLHEIAGPHP